MATPPSPSHAGYRVPATLHRIEEVNRRSRFITSVARAATRDDALAFVARIRAEFPDATHNCWAFVAGPPGDSSQVGMSDDGEPHGTAGRPMLTALLNGGVGEVVAVVTRYFGGVKLGRGGLGRAYGRGVVASLESLPTELRVPRREMEVVLGHADVSDARRIFERLGVDVVDEVWGEEVAYHLSVPTDAIERLRAELGALTRGRAEVRDR